MRTRTRLTKRWRRATLAAAAPLLALAFSLGAPSVVSAKDAYESGQPPRTWRILEACRTWYMRPPSPLRVQKPLYLREDVRFGDAKSPDRVRNAQVQFRGAWTQRVGGEKVQVTLRHGPRQDDARFEERLDDLPEAAKSTASQNISEVQLSPSGWDGIVRLTGSSKAEFRSKDWIVILEAGRDAFEPSEWLAFLGRVELDRLLAVSKAATGWTAQSAPKSLKKLLDPTPPEEAWGTSRVRVDEYEGRWAWDVLEGSETVAGVRVHYDWTSFGLGEPNAAVSGHPGWTMGWSQWGYSLMVQHSDGWRIEIRPNENRADKKQVAAAIARELMKRNRRVLGKRPVWMFEQHPKKYAQLRMRDELTAWTSQFTQRLDSSLVLQESGSSLEPQYASASYNLKWQRSWSSSSRGRGSEQGTLGLSSRISPDMIKRIVRDYNSARTPGPTGSALKNGGAQAKSYRVGAWTVYRFFPREGKASWMAIHLEYKLILTVKHQFSQHTRSSGVRIAQEFMASMKKIGRGLRAMLGEAVPSSLVPVK